MDCTVGLKKCQFAKYHVEYLGHVITNNENLAHPKHLEQLKDCPVPNTVKQVRAFLGTAGWLRDFILRFSEKAAPITDLTRGKGKFRWSPEAQQAFEALKEEASKPLRLARPDFTKKIHPTNRCLSHRYGSGPIP